MKNPIWRAVFGLALLGSLALGFIGERHEPEAIWDYAVFFAVAGAVGCLLLSWVAKGVVSPLLDRPEDHYDEADADYDWSTESPVADRAPAADAGGEG